MYDDQYMNFLRNKFLYNWKNSKNRHLAIIHLFVVTLRKITKWEITKTEVENEMKILIALTKYNTRQ